LLIQIKEKGGHCDYSFGRQNIPIYTTGEQSSFTVAASRLGDQKSYSSWTYNCSVRISKIK
jgi:hypothetical protein